MGVVFVLLVFSFFTDSQIDAVDPFVDINQPPSTPSTEEGAGAASNGMHGGIAGIIVASVFLGIGALVGLTWFGKGCFFGLFGSELVSLTFPHRPFF